MGIVGFSRLLNFDGIKKVVPKNICLMSLTYVDRRDLSFRLPVSNRLYRVSSARYTPLCDFCAYICAGVGILLKSPPKIEVIKELQIYYIKHNKIPPSWREMGGLSGLSGFILMGTKSQAQIQDMIFTRGARGKICGDLFFEIFGFGC